MDDFARRDALRLAVAAGALCVGGLRVGPAHAGLPGDDAAAWLEEHWSVDLAVLPQFLAAYDANILALARRTPGYLGHMVMTAPDHDHADAANWDALFGRAYNVLVTHHIRTWTDADAFRERIAALHDGAHPGTSLHRRLARTVFPHARNYRDAAFRTVDVSHLGKAATGRSSRPTSGPILLLGEHWQAPAGGLAAWLRRYDVRVQEILGDDSNYCGYRVATSLPLQEWEACGPRLTVAAGRRLGGEDALYVKSPGIVGACSDVSIDVGALYNNTYNIVVLHRMRGDQDAGRWLERLSNIHRDHRSNAVFAKAWTNRRMNNASVV